MSEIKEKKEKRTQKNVKAALKLLFEEGNDYETRRWNFPHSEKKRNVDYSAFVMSASA